MTNVSPRLKAADGIQTELRKSVRKCDFPRAHVKPTFTGSNCTRSDTIAAQPDSREIVAIRINDQTVVVKRKMHRKLGRVSVWIRVNINRISCTVMFEKYFFESVSVVFAPSLDKPV